MAHPMLMFEPDPDMMISYNFDRLTTYDQKKILLKRCLKISGQSPMTFLEVR